MQEVEFISCIYYIILFFCSRRSYVKFYTLPNNENVQQKELQSIAINQSADIGCKDFMNIYRKCTSKPYSFLIIDTTLLANNSLKFRKNILLLYKNDINC